MLFTAHRLPAPISEIATPTPEQSAKPKPKRTIKPKVASEKTESVKQATRATVKPAKSQVSAQPQREFSGTWKGKIKEQVITIVIDANETQAAATGGPWGTEQGTTRINQDTISWTYVFNSWSLTVARGTKTAQVVEHGLGGTASGTFEKTN